MGNKVFLSLVFSCFVCAIEAQQCGYGKSSFSAFAVGGGDSKKGNWPWIVALIHIESKQFFCGGSLVSAKHVLSGEIAKVI